MWWIWAPVGLALGVAYSIVYVLLRTSGDGRPWHARLRHPGGRSGERRGDPPGSRSGGKLP